MWLDMGRPANILLDRGQYFARQGPIFCLTGAIISFDRGQYFVWQGPSCPDAGTQRARVCLSNQCWCWLHWVRCTLHQVQSGSHELATNSDQNEILVIKVDAAVRYLFTDNLVCRISKKYLLVLETRDLVAVCSHDPWLDHLTDVGFIRRANLSVAQNRKGTESGLGFIWNANVRITKSNRRLAADLTLHICGEPFPRKKQQLLVLPQKWECASTYSQVPQLTFKSGREPDQYMASIVRFPNLFSSRQGAWLAWHALPSASWIFFYYHRMSWTQNGGCGT